MKARAVFFSRGAMAAVAAAAIGCTSAASAAEVGGGVTLTSDYLFRGVSQTLGQPAMQGYVDVGFESGLYAYAWATNVDFVPDGAPDDSANMEVDLALGYAREFGHWALGVEFVRYSYPHNEAGYDYLELVATLAFDETWRASAGFSNDVFGSGANGLYFAIGADVALPAGLVFSADAGYYDLSAAYAARYSYVDLGLSRTFDAFEVTLDYVDTFGDANEIFNSDAIGSRFVLAVHYTLAGD